MAEMEAAVLDSWGGDLAVDTVSTPEPGPDEVRVDVQACGVTRTIENAVQGGLAADPELTPRIPGHEFAGVVEAVGEDVTDDRLAHVDHHTDGGAIPVDASDDDFPDRLAEATPYGDGPTVVVDTVGDKATLRDAWDAMAMGGRLVSLTTHHDRSLDVPLREYVEKEAALLGSRYATKDEVVRAARLLADGRVEGVVTDAVSLGEVPAVHEAIRRGETHGMTVLEP